MASTAAFPSLLVFGPQTKLPSAEVLAELRKVLVENPQLAGLCEAVKGLPTLWQKLTESDPKLRHVPGAEYLGDLQRWIEHGVFPYPVDGPPPPNVYALPVTILLQIALYIRYLNRLGGRESHRLVLEGLKAGGIQGFCIGFLTAIAVACAKTVEDIAALGAVSLRLALCVGAYVDQDGCFAEPPNKTACVAVRWRYGELENEGIATIIQAYPDVSEACISAEGSKTNAFRNRHIFQA